MAQKSQPHSRHSVNVFEERVNCIIKDIPDFQHAGLRSKNSPKHKHKPGKAVGSRHSGAPGCSPRHAAKRKCSLGKNAKLQHEVQVTRHKTPGMCPSAWDRNSPHTDTGVTELLARPDRPASRGGSRVPSADGKGAATEFGSIRGKNPLREGEERTESIHESLQPRAAPPWWGKAGSSPGTSGQRRPRVLTTAIRQEKETELSLLAGHRMVWHRGSREEDT